MNRGWLRLGMVLVIVWWAFCAWAYHRWGVAAQNAGTISNFTPMADGSVIVDGSDVHPSEGMLAAQAMQNRWLVLAIAVPLCLSALGGVVAWIARGFATKP